VFILPNPLLKRRINMDLGFKDKVAVVTGGASGLEK